MNNIGNVLILAIMLGLFNLQKKHIEEHFFIVSIMFFTSLAIIYYTINYNNEHFISSIATDDDITLLEKGEFELLAHTRNRDQDLYLHSTIPMENNKSDCVMSGNAGCNDVCVVNKIKHDERPHKWTFNNLGKFFEIKYRDSYLSSTLIGDDCSAVYDSDICRDVILINDSAYNKQAHSDKTYWILEKINNPAGTIGANYYAIRAYINNMPQLLYLYCILQGDGDDGQDCESAGLKKYGCRNVFLAPQDSHTFSQTLNPVYWRLFLDPSSVPESIMHKSNETQISISENALPRPWESLRIRLSGTTYDKFININKNVGLVFNTESDTPSGLQYRSIQFGKGNDWLSVPKESSYILRHVSKNIVNETEKDGFSCSSYDDNTNYICIKESDNPNIETNIMTIPAGQTNFAAKGQCVVTLSSLNNKKKDTSENVIDEDPNTVAMSGFEENPKLHLWLNEDVIIRKIIIKQHIYNPFNITIYNSNKEVEHSTTFREEDKVTESVYVIDNITLKGRYILIEVTKKGTLALNNIFVIGTSASIPQENESVQKTIKNERAICNIRTKQEKEKHQIQLSDKIRETEDAMRQKTINDILSFINTPQSVIMWENIRIPCRGIKIELLRKDYLHISNIQIFGTSTRATSSIDKDWAKDDSTVVKLSSTFTDESETFFGAEKCIDDNLDTYCRTLNTENPYPFITLDFKEDINIDKIIIYNRKDKNRQRLVPCKVSLIDGSNQTITYAIKKSFKTNLEISKSFMESPLGCFSFKELGITDIGNVNKFRGWADVEGNGMKCNFCRVVGNEGQQFFSCASSSGDNQYKYNTFPNVDLGDNNSTFMSDVYGSNKDDFCRCVGNRYNKQVECLVNNVNEPNIGFNAIHQPNISCNGKTGEELQTEITGNIEGKDLSIENRIDTGFYYKEKDLYYLFKNTQIDNKNVVLYVKMNRKHEKITNPRLVTTGTNSEWKGLNDIFKSGIDCTLTDGNDHVYFFKDNFVSKYNIKTKKSVTNMIKINVEFPNIPFDTIDEAYYAGSGIALFFKGNKFVQYNIDNQNNKKMRIITTHISQGNFGKMNFERIDTAISFTNDNDIQEILFTRNGKCMIYNDSESQHDNEYNSVIDISKKYPNLWEINLDEINKSDIDYSSTSYQIEPPTSTAATSTAATSTAAGESTTSPSNILDEFGLGGSGSGVENGSGAVPGSGAANGSGAEQRQYIVPSTQHNLYSSCNLPSTTIKYQSNILGKNKHSEKTACKVKITRPKKVQIIHSILQNGSLTRYLKNTNKDINTLSCELDIQPNIIMIEATKGTFSNPEKLIKFIKKSQELKKSQQLISQESEDPQSS